MISPVRAAYLASVALPLLVFAAPVWAEDVATEGPNQVSEIVVTAQRREAPLAATPLSLTVAAQPLLNDVGVRDIKDLQILTPGLIVASTSNQTFTTARIRGVGTVGDNPGLESSVGVMIDGVYRPRNCVPPCWASSARRSWPRLPATSPSATCSSASASRPVPR